MKTIFLRLNRLLFGTVAGLSLFSLFLPQPSQAQTATDVNPLQDLQPQKNSDPFSGANDGSSINSVFDLIHRAQLGGASYDDNAAQENLDSAAAEFLSKQRQLLPQVQNQQPNPANSLNTTPQPVK